jgi:hypothetical protein
MMVMWLLGIELKTSRRAVRAIFPAWISFFFSFPFSCVWMCMGVLLRCMTVGIVLMESRRGYQVWNWRASGTSSGTGVVVTWL